MRRINPTIATLGLLFAFAAAPTPAQAGPAGRLDNAFQLRLGGFQPPQWARMPRRNRRHCPS